MSEKEFFQFVAALNPKLSEVIDAAEKMGCHVVVRMIPNKSPAAQPPLAVDLPPAGGEIEPSADVAASH